MIRFTAASISRLAAETAPRLDSAVSDPSDKSPCAVNLSIRREMSVLIAIVSARISCSIPHD
jgi:hypothetical protein